MCLAVPGQVLSIAGDDDLSRVGKVSFGGVVKEANLCFVPEVKVGDYVIVHVGFALSVVDEAEANKVFEYLRQMDDLTELQPEGRASLSPPTGPLPDVAPVRTGARPEAEPSSASPSSQTLIGS